MADRLHVAGAGERLGLTFEYNADVTMRQWTSTIELILAGGQDKGAVAGIRLLVERVEFRPHVPGVVAEERLQQAEDRIPRVSTGAVRGGEGGIDVGISRCERPRMQQSVHRLPRLTQRHVRVAEHRIEGR